VLAPVFRGFAEEVTRDHSHRKMITVFPCDLLEPRPQRNRWRGDGVVATHAGETEAQMLLVYLIIFITLSAPRRPLPKPPIQPA
jgi:hypothetical protein